MFRALILWLIACVWREPDFIIGADRERPYMLRWYVIPRNRFFNVYLHKFLRDDDDRALHDHPWSSVSLLLSGSYLEWTEDLASFDGRRVKKYDAGSLIFRGAEYAHRVELINGKPAWTLFITGPRVREWGFHCPKAWVHWREFTSAEKPGEVGRGCGEVD